MDGDMPKGLEKFLWMKKGVYNKTGKSTDGKSPPRMI